MKSGSAFLRQASIVSGASFLKTAEDRFLFPLHKHDDTSEMLLILEGEGTFGVDGCAYTAGPGTLLFYHRGVWHEEASTRHPFRGIYIGFTGLQLQGLPPDYFFDPHKPPIIRLHEQLHPIRELFEACIREHRSSEPEAQTMADHWLGLLLTRLFRLAYGASAAPGAERKPSQTAVMLAKKYIEEQYRTAITLAKLAKITYVNEYHLAHLFKDELGISPIQFLIRYRMEVAGRYLSTTTLPMKEIAELVGYQSETSFHNAFKKMMGVTPGGYREKGSETEEERGTD